MQPSISVSLINGFLVSKMTVRGMAGIYGAGGIIVPFIGIKAIDLLLQTVGLV